VKLSLLIGGRIKLELHLLSDGFFELNMGFLVYGKPDYYQKTYWASLSPLLVITDDHRILCDSGLGNLPDKYQRWYKVKRPDNGLARGLEKAGLTHEDIDYIIQTHLHFDHFSQDIEAFTNAKIIAQTEEIRYAFLPDRFQAGAYSPIKHLLGKATFEPVVSFAEVFDGIDVIPTPGHTPGHQSVAIQTDEKLIIYTGDAAPLQENLERQNIPGVLWSSWQALESLELLRDLEADQYIFAHSNPEAEVQ
jgi:glyoxylase-like metal-dependent hydrolase (beta-lactamase superfamily II)